MDATQLHIAAKRAGFLVSGARVGDATDRNTWVVELVDPTLDQLTAVAAFIATYDPLAASEVTAVKQEAATLVVDSIFGRAIARATWEELQKMTPRNGQVPLTAPEFRARIIAIAQNLL